MTDRRVPKPLPENLNRPLLDLGGGDRQGLERAFQALVGRAKSPGPSVAPFLKILQSLDFVPDTAREAGQVYVSHPLAADRWLKVVVEAGRDPQDWTLEWAGRHFPEMEFYLPYISLRASRAKKLVGHKNRPLAPEPEYDEDGFLADYP